MNICRCYKFSMNEFEEMLKAFSKDIKQEIIYTCKNQKIKLEGAERIPFNEFARYMVSIECDDHIAYRDDNGRCWLYIFGHKYK